MTSENKSFLPDSANPWIGGRSVVVESGQTFAVCNPATGETVRELQLAGASEAQRAVESAALAFEAWKHTTPAERSALLLRLGNLLLVHREALAELRVAEQGATLD